jgi:hypothetical protein
MVFRTNDDYFPKTALLDGLCNEDAMFSYRTEFLIII